METKVFFHNSKGDKLCGILRDPSGDKIKPLVILVHGLNSNKNTKNYLKLIRVLNKNQIASLRFDIFGHGESEGKFEDLTVSEAVDDILQAINFLKRKGYKRFGLVGSSFGGAASIMAASKSDLLLFLALKSPVSNYEDKTKKLLTKEEIDNWKRKGYRIIEDDGKRLKLKYAYFKDFKNNNGWLVAHLIKIPTLIVHGDADRVVPVEESITFSKLLANCQLVRIKGADHTYTKEKHAKQMNQALSKFIINQCKKHL